MILLVNDSVVFVWFKNACLYLFLWFYETVTLKAGCIWEVNKPIEMKNIFTKKKHCIVCKDKYTVENWTKSCSIKTKTKLHSQRTKRESS